MSFLVPLHFFLPSSDGYGVGKLVLMAVVDVSSILSCSIRLSSLLFCFLLLAVCFAFSSGLCVSSDGDGVGKLVRMAVVDGRKGHADTHNGARLEIGVCGETGGEPSSVIQYHKYGMISTNCGGITVLSF